MKLHKTAYAVLLILCLGGCSPLRHYKFADHCGTVACKDSSAGDLTHSADPGARVVVPKKAKR